MQQIPTFYDVSSDTNLLLGAININTSMLTHVCHSKNLLKKKSLQIYHIIKTKLDNTQHIIKNNEPQMSDVWHPAGLWLPYIKLSIKFL